MIKPFLLQTGFVEGAKKLTITNKYERNKIARTKCINLFFSKLEKK